MFCLKQVRGLAPVVRSLVPADKLSNLWGAQEARTAAAINAVCSPSCLCFELAGMPVGVYGFERGTNVFERGFKVCCGSDVFLLCC